MKKKQSVYQLSAHVFMPMLAMWFFALMPLQAQESLRQYSDWYANLSIKYWDFCVREVSAGQWLVGHNYHAGTDAGFMLVGENDTLATVKAFNNGIEGGCVDYPIHFSDMEIAGDTVFFCGQYRRGPFFIGVVGYFPLQGFPNNPVTVFPVYGTDTVERIDVLTDSHGRHRLLAVWNGNNGWCTMAEFVPDGPMHYQVYTAHPGVENPGFDVFEDVAVLDNKVVFSARSTTTDSVTLHYFAYPSSNFSTFQSYRRSVRTKMLSGSRTRLAAGAGNEVAVVGEGSAFSIYAPEEVRQSHPLTFVVKMLIVSDFATNDMSVLVHSIYASVPTVGKRVVDVRYNEQNDDYEALVNERDSCESLIYCFSKNVNVVSMLRMENSVPRALAYLPQQPGSFLAILDSYWDMPYVYRYSHADRGHCMELDTVTNVRGLFRRPRYDIQPFILTTDSQGEDFPFSVNQTSILPVCTYGQKNEE